MKKHRLPRQKEFARLPEIVLRAAEEVDVSLLRWWGRLGLRERLRACASVQRLGRRLGNGAKSAQRS